MLPILKCYQICISWTSQKMFCAWFKKHNFWYQLSDYIHNLKCYLNAPVIEQVRLKAHRHGQQVNLLSLQGNLLISTHINVDEIIYICYNYLNTVFSIKLSFVKTKHTLSKRVLVTDTIAYYFSLFTFTKNILMWKRMISNTLLHVNCNLMKMYYSRLMVNVISCK